VTDENCFVRLTDRGLAFLAEGARMAALGEEAAKDE